jgi:hypothetical protein
VSAANHDNALTPHAYLVHRAARWLRGTAKCAVVATEKSPPHIMVIPDAIGWTRDGYSVVVECKVSRADFLADKRKISRAAGILVGDERWYLTMPGVATPSDLEPGVGLIEMAGRSLRKVVKAARRGRPLAERAESVMLAHVAWHAVNHHFGRKGWPTMTAHNVLADEAKP